MALYEDPLIIGQDVQAWSARLDSIAAQANTSFGISLLTLADAAALRTAAALGTVATLAADTDTALTANSDVRIATQKATKAYVDNAVTGLLDFKGSTDASGNPNYPAASKGDAYVVSVAGKIGGASGKSVDVGDVYVASADNAGAAEASVGTSWFVLEHNLQGALLSANNLSDLASAATARTNLGLGTAAVAAATDFATAAQGALADSAAQPVRGTWTPTDASGAGLALTVEGRYTKIDRMVFAGGVVVYPANASGSVARIGGLPFTCANFASARGGFVSYNEHSAWLGIAPDANDTKAYFFAAGGGNPTNANLSGKTFIFTLIYEAA